MIDAATNTLEYVRPPYVESVASVRPLLPFEFEVIPRPNATPSAADPVAGNYSRIEPWDEFAGHYAQLADIESNQTLWPEDAEGPSQEAIAWAGTVLDFMRAYALMPSRVVATAEGGVAICLVRDGKYSDIECFNTGAILGVTSDRHARPIVWEIEPSARGISSAAERIRAFLPAPVSKKNAAKRARS